MTTKNFCLFQKGTFFSCSKKQRVNLALRNTPFVSSTIESKFPFAFGTVQLCYQQSSSFSLSPHFPSRLYFLPVCAVQPISGEESQFLAGSKMCRRKEEREGEREKPMVVTHSLKVVLKEWKRRGEIGKAYLQCLAHLAQKQHQFLCHFKNISF